MLEPCKEHLAEDARPGGKTGRVRLQLEARSGIGGEAGHRLYGVVAITAGEGNGLQYLADTLRRAVPLFQNSTCFVDHDGWDDMWRGNRSLREVLGVLREVAFSESDQGVVGTLDVYPGQDQEWFCRLADAYIRDRAAGRPAPRVGLSCVLDVLVDAQLQVVAIERVYSVDAVFDPARGGEIVRALNQKSVSGCRLPVTGAGGDGEPVNGQLQKTSGGVGVGDKKKSNGTEQAEVVESPASEVVPSATSAAAPAGEVRRVENAQTAPREVRETVPSPAGQAVAVPGGEVRAVRPAAGQRPADGVQAGVVSGQAEALVSLSDSVLETRLARTQLPAELQELVRAEFRGRLYNAGQTDARIEALQSAWGKAMAAAGGVHGVGAVRPSGIVVGLNEADKLQAVMNRLCGVQLASEALQGLPPVSGIRELYLMLTGDYDLRGEFDAKRVSLANVTTSTLSSLVKNAFNKVILDYFNVADRWWESIVSQEDFASTQDLTLITLGGFSDLPAVSEGAAYTELSWSDAEEVVAFAKKGGYVGVTLEMMDKDDTRAFRAIPRKLAIAGYRTLSAAIANLWTDSHLVSFATTICLTLRKKAKGISN